MFAMRGTLALLALTTFAAADESAPKESLLGAELSIELNATQVQETGCLLSFVVQNGHPVEISSAIFEAVLFNGSGQVDRLTLFDFGSLPPARPRVRQFVVPALQCDNLSRLIFNGASTCEGEGVTPALCEDTMSLKSRVATEVQG